MGDIPVTELRARTIEQAPMPPALNITSFLDDGISRTWSGGRSSGLAIRELLGGLGVTSSPTNNKTKGVACVIVAV